VHYKNQQIVIGFLKHTDTYPISSAKKTFLIHLNFKEKEGNFKQKLLNLTKKKRLQIIYLLFLKRRKE